MIPSKSQHQKGFTLIELMIVIAIIGVLAAIALPMYQDYVLKAQITRVYYELSATRDAIDDIVLNGNTPTLDPKQDSKETKTGGRYEYLQVNGDDPQSNMIYIANLDIQNDQVRGIKALFGRDAYKGIHELEIVLTRNPQEAWTCTFHKAKAPAWKDKFLPPNCTAK